MIVTNVGGPVTVGACHLRKGSNEVEPKVWQEAKQHRLVKAFLHSGRIIEGAARMPPRGTIPPGAVAHNPDDYEMPDARNAIPTAANLGKAEAAKPAAPVEPKPEAPAPSLEASEADSAEATSEAGESTEGAEDSASEEAKDATEYAAKDAKLIIQECSDLQALEGWKAKESRTTVLAEIDARIAALTS